MLRSSDTEYAHGPQEVFKSFEIIKIFLKGFFKCGRILENGFSFSSNGSKPENCKCIAHDRSS